MVKKRATKKSAPKGRKAPKKSARKAPKKAARKAMSRKAVPRKSAPRKAKPARRAAGRAAPRKSAVKKKRSPVRKTASAKSTGRSRKAAARKDFPARPVAVTSGSAAGEVYGEEGWREEELSARERGTDTVELDDPEAESDGPEIVEENDDSPEW